MPSVRCVSRRGTYLGMMVDTIPTPMKNIASMQAAMSQCSKR